MDVCWIGSDGFHVTTPPTGFVQQPQNQPPNQGGSIRGMAPTGPPTQASTPPQNEQMKQMSQPSGQMAPLFVQPPVRPNQNYHYRAPQSNPGNQRMAGHHRQVASNVATNQMYPHTVSIYPGPIPPTMGTYPIAAQPYPNPSRPYFPIQQYTTVLPQQFIHGSYPTQQPQAPQTYYSQFPPQPMSIPRQVGPSAPTVPTTPQGNNNQPQQPAMPAPLGPQQPKKKRREKAIPIINPQTGKDINEETESLPPSGDSSARETPQPNSGMQVVAEFAARVAIVASEGKIESSSESEQSLFQQQNAQTQNIDDDHLQKMESVVQNSKLQVLFYFIQIYNYF